MLSLPPGLFMMHSPLLINTWDEFGTGEKFLYIKFMYKIFGP